MVHLLYTSLKYSYSSNTSVVISVSLILGELDGNPGRFEPLLQVKPLNSKLSINVILKRSLKKVNFFFFLFPVPALPT